MIDMSVNACHHAARRLRDLFAGTAVLWEFAGTVRRNLPGREICHVVIPKAPKGGQHSNAVWERAVELLATDQVSVPAEGWMPADDYTVLLLTLDRIPHRLHLATADNFGPRLAWLTGPKGYWAMLLARLQAADTLRLHRGCVCAINRSTEPPTFDTIPCRHESMFFQLARTRPKSPPYRFEHPDGSAADWRRGMLPEWYPPGVKVYASPQAQPGLYDTSKIIPPPFRPRDPDRWRHS